MKIYDDEKIYYVYLLLDPFNFYLPFYIGKGKNNRWKEHTKTIEGKNNPRKYNKIKKILKEYDEIPKMFWSENLCEKSACLLEINLIKKFGRKYIDNGGILLNISSDSFPCREKGTFTHSDETRNKISETKRGVSLGPPSLKHRKKISNALKGTKKSSESIQKRLRTMASKSDEEKSQIKNKQRESRLNQVFSTESLKKAANSRKGQTRSDETRKKMSEAAKGKTISPETRAKMRKSRLEYFRRKKELENNSL